MVSSLATSWSPRPTLPLPLHHKYEPKRLFRVVSSGRLFRGKLSNIEVNLRAEVIVYSSVCGLDFTCHWCIERTVLSARHHHRNAIPTIPRPRTTVVVLGACFALSVPRPYRLILPPCKNDDQTVQSMRPTRRQRFYASRLLAQHSYDDHNPHHGPCSCSWCALGTVREVYNVSSHEKLSCTFY